MAFRADRLRQLIEDVGITTKELAKAVGVSDRMIRNYKAGKHTPEVEHVTRLADILNTNVEYLMDRTSYPKRLTDIHYRVLEAFTEGDENRLVDLLRQHLIQKGLGKKPITRRKPPVK